LVVDIVVGDSHIDIGAIASITTSAVYAFDGSSYDGNLILNDTETQYLTVGKRGYTVASASGDSYGISVFSVNPEVYVIWDRLEVYWSQTELERADLGTTIEVRFKVHYQYNGIAFTGADGSLQVNGLDASYDDIGNFWYISVSNDTVGQTTYRVSGFTETTAGLTLMTGNNTHPSVALFDRVYVDEAGVWGRRPAFDPEVEIPAPDTLEVETGVVVTVYFYLRYESDDAYVSNPDAVVTVNGTRASYSLERERWEASVTSGTAGSEVYVIETFQDPSGLTQISSTSLVPSIEWIIPPPLFPIPLLIAVIVAVVLVGSYAFIRARRRMEMLEHALTPEELLSIEDIGMPQEMRDQTFANLEWLRGLPEEIPSMGDDVLSILWEELEKARTMYERAFEMETISGAAGTELRSLLLKRFDSVIEMIEREMESRA
ncbi:MAG: hypothetical protein ACFFD9_10995, partial [Candidatus Thorarchaeota archaeon]